MGEIFSESEKMRNVAEVRENAEGPFELRGYKCIVRIVNVVCVPYQPCSATQVENNRQNWI